MIEFRRLGCLTLLVALVACTAEQPKSSQGRAVPDTGSVSSSADAASTPAPGNESIESPAEDRSDAETLTPDGWGPLRIGMSLAEITAAAGADADPGAVGGPDPARCDEFRPGDAPDGVLVMVENGVLTRISVSRNRRIRTPEGLRIGDAESRVLSEYGSRAQIEPHRYWQAPAKYITVWREPPSSANPRGIRYEIDSDGNVAHIRAGGPGIEYVEGCV